MPWYSINTAAIIGHLREHNPDIKQVWLADDAAAGGKIRQLLSWYQQLIGEGRKYGYYVNGSKSWLVVKSQDIAEEAKNVFGDKGMILGDLIWYTQRIQLISRDMNIVNNIEGPLLNRKLLSIVYSRPLYPVKLLST